MRKVNLAAGIFIIAIAPGSMISWAISVDKKVPVKTELISDEATLRQYNAFIRMDAEEMEATKGKVGPIIGGAISGATVGIVSVISSDPNFSPSTVNIVAAGVGGAVGGGLSPVIGLTAGGVVGVAVNGAIRDVFSGGNAGNAGCYSSGCHGIEK